MLDDAALLWWYALPEEKRTDIELWCVSEGVPLHLFVYLYSGSLERLWEPFDLATQDATESIRLFADTLTNTEFGLETDTALHKSPQQADPGPLG